MMDGIRRREWLLALAVVVAIKLAWLALDAQVRVFMGDSASYLYYATIREAPPDRSFTYPLLIRWFALPFGEARPMLVAQTVFGIFTALFVFGTLRTMLAVRFGIALAAAAFIATEPSQVFFERMLMAESAGTLCFAGALACGIAYVRRPHPRWLAYGAILMAGAVSFRLNMLPIALGMAMVPPLVVLVFAWRSERRIRAIGAALIAFVVSLGATAIAQKTYQHWYAAHSAHADGPAYTFAEGTMRLALVAPLVKREYFDAYGLPPDLLDTVVPPLDEHQMRETQMWAGDGLIARLTEAEPKRTQVIARKVAIKSLRNDLPGFFAMQWRNFIDYFDDAVAAHRMADELGVREPDPGAVEWFRQTIQLETAKLYERHTPAYVAFANSRWWLTACLYLLVPIALLALWRGRADLRPVSLYLACIAGGLVAANFLFSMIISYRYLHAFPIPLVIAVAILLDRRRQPDVAATN